MIDYAQWKPPQYSVSHAEPVVLTQKQRTIFWCYAVGMGTYNIARHLQLGATTVKIHRRLIRDRIPGLTSAAAFGALAAEITASLRSVDRAACPRGNESKTHRTRQSN